MLKTLWVINLAALCTLILLLALDLAIDLPVIDVVEMYDIIVGL